MKIDQIIQYLVFDNFSDQYKNQSWKIYKSYTRCSVMWLHIIQIDFSTARVLNL